MTKAIKEYVDNCFSDAKAPRTKAVALLKKEVYLRLVQYAKFFVKHGMSEETAAQSSVKTLTNVRAMTAAAIREENKNNSSHNIVKSIAIVFAFICFIMSFFPLIKFKNELIKGIIIFIGLIAAGIGFSVYAAKKRAKPVDVEKICERFEVGVSRHAVPQKKQEEKHGEYIKPHVNSRMVADETYEEPSGKKSVYSITSKFIWLAGILMFFVCIVASKSWKMSLLVFPLCFSLSRLTKAFTDFFRIKSKEEEGDGE